MKKLLAQLKSWSTHPRLPLWTALTAVLLCAPSLFSGLFLDDYIHLATLTHPPDLPELHGSPNDLFAFVAEDHNPMGSFLPWWSSKDLRLAMWRPVSGLSHWLDTRLWLSSPVLMHLHSLAWLALTVWAATVAFRRFFGPELQGVAFLAAAFFAVDDVHAWPAMWVANRNALISCGLGLLCLIAHDRQRREAWRPGFWISPALLLLAVLSGESAVACGGYLLAYALFLERGSLKDRLNGLIPHTAVGLAWITTYKLQGFGARGSSAYLDPIEQPLRFLFEALQRLPILINGLWSPLPADLYLLASQDGRRILWGISIALMIFVGTLLWPLRRDRRVRFFTFGLIASLVPACIPFPMNRQLFYPSFASAALLALVTARAVEGRPARIGRLGTGALAAGFVAVHLLLAPLILLAFPAQLKLIDSLIERGARSLPSDPAISQQRLIVVNAPSHVFTSGAKIIQVLDGRPFAVDMLVLSTGLGAVDLYRPTPSTLAVRPRLGFLPPSQDSLTDDTVRDSPAEEALFHTSRAFTGFDTLFFDSRQLPKVGERFDRSWVGIEMTGVDGRGRPNEATFEFDRPLEDPSLRWVQWRNGLFVPFEPPKIHHSDSLPAPTLAPP